MYKMFNKKNKTQQDVLPVIPVDWWRTKNKAKKILQRRTENLPNRSLRLPPYDRTTAKAFLIRAEAHQ